MSSPVRRAFQAAQAEQWGVEVLFSWRNPMSRSSYTYEHLALPDSERALCGASTEGMEPSHETVDTFMLRGADYSRACKRCRGTVAYKQLQLKHAERLQQLQLEREQAKAQAKAEREREDKESRKRYEQRQQQRKVELLKLELWPKLMALVLRARFVKDDTTYQVELSSDARELVKEWETRSDDIEGGGEGLVRS